MDFRYTYLLFFCDHDPKLKAKIKIIVNINVWLENTGCLLTKFMTIEVTTYTDKLNNSSFHQAILGPFFKGLHLLSTRVKT